MTASPTSSPVGSVDKALVLLGVLAGAGPEGLMLRDIAAETGFSKASTHRLLQALIHREYAAQDPAGQRYRLGSAPLELSQAYSRGDNLPVIFGPLLAGISQATQELVHLGQLEGTSVLYLDKVEPERTLRVWSRVGRRTPAARTALGRAMLAADAVTDEGLRVYAEATTAGDGLVMDSEYLRTVVAETRERGWSMECEENEPGIACVGIALVRPDGHSVAVSVTGPVERMHEERRAEVGALLRGDLAQLAPAGFTIVPVGAPGAAPVSGRGA